VPSPTRSLSATEAGQTAAFFAIFLALVMGGLVFGIVNLAQAYQVYGILDNAVLVGAQNGAGDIDQSTLFESRVKLAGSAVQLCEAAITSQLAQDSSLRSKSAVDCSVAGGGTTITATATVTVAVFALGPGWGPTLTLTSAHSSTAAYGVREPVAMAP
jgi:hypothetical protein